MWQDHDRNGRFSYSNVIKRLYDKALIQERRKLQLSQIFIYALRQFWIFPISNIVQIYLSA